MHNSKLPAYEAPEVTTYTDEQILEELGPALTQITVYSTLSGQYPPNPTATPTA